MAPLQDGDAVAARDSKNPAGGTLRFSAREWSEFLARIKADGFE
ncbi:DUF397 domain-containing protein [Actinomadura adrarensis]|uniref:DUF397 domain-containing protein n=1 Tax=Actinomadura adrarensis TaxID=1819600 RepID=A0ABW3CN34_9ACTN